MSQPNPYQLLGVARDATRDEVMSAFRKRVYDLGQAMSVTSPDYNRQRSQLYQAVSVLADPAQRKLLDATVGTVADPIKSTDAQYIWQMVEKLYSERPDHNTTALNAIRASIPLAIESENLLIVGIDSVHGNLLGYLNSSETRTTLRRFLSEICGRSMNFRVVTAVTEKEWQLMRDAEEKVHRARMANGASHPVSREESAAPRSGGVTTAPPVEQKNGNGEWDDVMEGLMRLWSATESRSFPQVRARLILDSLTMIARAEAIAHAHRISDEALQRALGRALDRVGSLTGTDSALIAIEYLRLRGENPGGK